MPTLKIPKQLRRDLRLVSVEGETVSMTIERCIPKALPNTELRGHTNIEVSEECYQKLKELKEDGESFVSVIRRVIEGNPESIYNYNRRTVSQQYNKDE